MQQKIFIRAKAVLNIRPDWKVYALTFPDIPSLRSCCKYSLTSPIFVKAGFEEEGGCEKQNNSAEW